MEEQDRSPNLPHAASDATRRPAGDDRPTEPVDEESYGASAAESGGVYDKDGPTAANVAGDTMGMRDDAEPGEDAEGDPYSG